MIQVPCVGGKCNGLFVYIDPEVSAYFEVVDPKDTSRRDSYTVEVIRGTTRLVPIEAEEPPAATT